MHGSLPQRLNSMFAKRNKEDKRRPAGVSRRRKRQFLFEALEPRQVMSAESPVAGLAHLVGQNIQAQVTSYSSNTLEGQLAQMADELYWQSLTSGAGSAVAVPRAIPSDPLLGSQWHLINSGQNTGGPDWQPIYGVPGEDINVANVWNQGIFGNGVTVGVIDSGVQLNHPDLAANIDLSRQYNSLTGTFDGSPTDPTLNPLNAHGTGVAGLIGAVANNGIGGVGVAPGVTLAPINFGDTLGAPVSNALRFAIQHGIDITNNSYGPPDTVRTVAAPSQQELLSLRDSVIFGRNGLGIINVWASGNGAGTYGDRPGFSGTGVFDSSNYDGYANSRYTIAVTGIDHDGSYNNVDGTVTNYMEAGSNVLVAAPTGSVSLDIGTDTLVGSGLLTTDVVSLLNGRDVAGLNTSPDINTGEQVDLAHDYFPDGAYTSRFNGTSGAAPIVSGVIALMLQANPNLTWRDVQEILVRSARQNDEFGIPTNGAGVQTQNLWIVNQTPIFHDPDLFLPNIPVDPNNRVYFPTEDPNAIGTLTADVISGRLVSDHYNASPSQLTNGAGYTVSQGRGVYGEATGTGHGVVDADLAVKLAQQWSLKNQSLPNELTFTSFVNAPGNAVINIPAAERGNMASGFIAVPGAIGGRSGFISYWNEYFDATPFDDPNQVFPYRGQPYIELGVPANNTMSVESVDVKVTITGNPSEALDHLRLLLVSPTGTYSELNHYWYDDPAAYGTPVSFQDISPSGVFLGDPGSVVNDTALTWTFNTNRSWGERSDDAIIYDPRTNEPIVDTIGFGDPLTVTIGDAIKQGWRLVVENWDANDAFGLQGVEVAWHGSPIAANSQRVQGFVGIDDNGDDSFNFNRTLAANGDLDGDGAIDRLGEVNNTIDLTEERFADNVTVSVRRTSDGALVDQFVTGADGNFYFDLVPDDYTITVEDPLSRTAKDDASTAAGFLRHYQREWHITSDWFRAWDHDATSIGEVLVNGAGTPEGWRDATGEFAATGVKGINFLLDPGAPIAPQAQVSGVVYADVNGDGAYNGNDINLPNITVFADINRNGVRDSGEATALTGPNGAYTLTVPLNASAVMNVAVQRPTQWTSTNDGPGATDSKTDGIETLFVKPGDAVSNVGFAIKPPADNIGGGGASQPGILLGVVFDDVNGNAVRDAGEAGAANLTVFLDNNNSGAPDAGDTITTTNEHGAFVFTNVNPGPRTVRLVVNSPLTQTTPAPGAGRQVNLFGSSTISSILFGIKNSAKQDFGDLPAIYHATLASEDGARHDKSLYWLGATIDTELDGHPSANADGDDLFAPGADEDGITFGPIVPGTTATLVATASRNNGVLQGWVDWNNDGDFNDAGERIITRRALNAGPNSVTFQVPAGANVNQVYARFRYGESTIDSVFGSAHLGEVEDYQLNVAVPVVQVVGIPSDADGDGDVDGMDFLTWQRNVGMATGATRAHGDANNDQRVTRADLSEWRQSYGPAAVAAAVMLPPTDDVGQAAALTMSLDASAAASSTLAASATSSDGATPAASAQHARAALNVGPLAGLVKRAFGEERASGRHDRLADDDASDAVDGDANVDGDNRRDRAFEDLFGSRRRQGLRTDVDFEQGDSADCDEAFALLADHFEWPLG